MIPDLSILLSELDDYETQRNWPALYMELLALQEQLDYTIDAAVSKTNMCKNRYRDVLPSDAFRVRLNRHPDYINANRCIVPLEGLGISKSYIMTQGPMEETSGDFWEMVWQENCTNIVMLTNTIENRTLKCHQYFPDVESPKVTYTTVFGTFVVRLVEQRKSIDFTVRKLSLELNGHPQARTVHHFHYIGWPDHGVPENPMSFVKFFLYLTSLNVLPSVNNHNANGPIESPSSPPPPPPILHCSAGIGRTGVLCVVDSCYTMLSNGCEVDMEKITDIIMALRMCRKGAVQTPEQLRFASFAVCSVGKAIVEGQVKRYIDDAASSLELCMKKGKRSAVVENGETPELPPSAPVAEPTGNRSSATASSDRNVEPSTVPARRSHDPRFVQQETESKRRRTSFLSKNWYFWALTKLQAATGNRQGIAVVTICVAALAVGVGFWKRSS